MPGESGNLPSKIKYGATESREPKEKKAARLITILEKTLNQEVSHTGRLVLRHGIIPAIGFSSFTFRKNLIRVASNGGSLGLNDWKLEK
jgi:hypothetical protein